MQVLERLWHPTNFICFWRSLFPLLLPPYQIWKNWWKNSPRRWHLRLIMIAPQIQSNMNIHRLALIKLKAPLKWKGPWKCGKKMLDSSNIYNSCQKIGSLSVETIEFIDAEAFVTPHAVATVLSEVEVYLFTLIITSLLRKNEALKLLMARFSLSIESRGLLWIIFNKSHDVTTFLFSC